MIDKSDHAESAATVAAAHPPRLRLSLRQLEVFVATAREGSTRAGASRVARSQSAASTALADFEAALGVPLFDRVGRRLVLNENGRAMLPKAASLLDQAAEAQHLFSGAGQPTPLRVAASLTIGEYLLPDLVAHWRAEHAASPVQLTVGNSTEVIAAVAAFEVDVGFIEGPQTHPDLIVRRWLSDELVIVAAPGHPLGGRAPTLRQLRDATWALREPGSGTREAADRWLLEHLGPLKVGFELGSPEAIKRLVAGGAALGCISRHAVATALAQGTLIELKTRLPPAVRRLAIVLHKDKHLGRPTEDFLRLCEAVERAAPAPR